MSKIIPTKEQESIIKSFRTERVLKVNACAGSGKSSTLRMLAEDNPVKSLYVCFNKVIQEDAKNMFPEWVDCRTTHSLAYRQHGTLLSRKLSRPRGGYVNVAGTPSEIAKYYNIHPIVDEGENELEVVSPTQIASLVKTTVDRFEYSGGDKLTKEILPYREMRDMLGIKREITNKQQAQLNELIVTVVMVCEKLWKDRIDTNSPVLSNHDTYLKLWQLSKPTLEYDIIYVDESQDMSPVMLDVIQRQEAKICFVGDSRQSIYQFRGAINAMEMVDAKQLHLSKSFRYGEEIANVANYVLYDNDFTIKGSEKINSTVTQESTTDKYTKIFRTNSALLHDAVNLVHKGYKVKCEVDVKSFINKLKAVENVYNNVKTNHPDLSMFKNWDQLVEGGEDDVELKRLINVVRNRNTNRFLSALNRLSSDRWDILLTTAHKSKGKEWGVVVIANDYPLSPIMGENMNEQEVNLFYVACTRAINNLQLPEDYLDEFRRD